MGDPEFFEDVLDNAAQLELTVMALPARPLPQAALCEDLCQRLIKGMGVDVGPLHLHVTLSRF